MPFIIACTDGSLYAPSIYQNAAWAATRMDAAIKILHVVGKAEIISSPPALSNVARFPNPFEELGQFDESHACIARLRGEELLEEARKFLIEMGTFEVTTIQRHGPLKEILQELEKTASLIVLGKRGEQADFDSGYLGENLGQVVRCVHVPVWVAARVFRPVHRFLVAFDGGPSSVKAIEYLASQPLLRGLDCHLISVGHPASPLATQLAAAAEKLQSAGFPVTTRMAAGDPAKVIAAEAAKQQVDLLVMGAYGRLRVRQLMLGSITTALIRGCELPLLLFR